MGLSKISEMSALPPRPFPKCRGGSLRFRNVRRISSSQEVYDSSETLSRRLDLPPGGCLTFRERAPTACLPGPEGLFGKNRVAPWIALPSSAPYATSDPPRRRARCHRASRRYRFTRCRAIKKPNASCQAEIPWRCHFGPHRTSRNPLLRSSRHAKGLVPPRDDAPNSFPAKILQKPQHNAWLQTSSLRSPGQSIQTHLTDHRGGRQRDIERQGKSTHKGSSSRF